MSYATRFWISSANGEVISETWGRGRYAEAMARHSTSRSSRRAKGRCKAAHVYGSGQPIGAGILRFVCRRCGTVSIDITEADVPTAIGPLFEMAAGTLTRP